MTEMDPGTAPGLSQGSRTEPTTYDADDPTGDMSGTTRMAGQSADANRPESGREWVSQLQSMIDNLATQAAPVLRQIGAKAAELAAAAGEKAGPIAHKAADVTEAAGSKLAERGREVAAELRRDGNGEGAAAGDTPNTIAPGPSAPSAPNDSRNPLGE